MAKNRVFIDVVVDDKGTTKRVAVNAKKLGLELDKTGKSASTADRNLKGAAQTSSNATKNFSKMAQGISGGLVPAYATLAAQVFAITAAFNFLQSAADFGVLATGQEAFAKSTGLAIKTLSEDIVTATNAQIGFKDASQAAAIGLASGLSPDQLRDLGTAARDASAVLGRDVTDSFNRLVRGVTKAEPELLDELGIILRLETASKKYADALGKDVKALTQFEKSQAVANDVLTQSQEKFSAVLTDQQKLGNAVTKFGKSFENNLLKPFQEALAKGITPVIEFLTDNIPALAAAFALLAIPIMKAIVPALGEMGDAAQQAADDAADALEQEIRKLEEKKEALLEVERVENNTRKKAAQSAQKATKDLQARKGSGLETLQTGGIPTDRQLAGMIRAAEKGTGEYKKLSDSQRAHVVKNFKLMQSSNKSATKAMTINFNVMVAKAKVGFKQMQVAYATVMTKMKKLTVGFANAADKALKMAGIIGTLMLIAELTGASVNKIVELMETEAERAARLRKEAKEDRFKEQLNRLKDINSELEKMTDTNKLEKAGANAAAFVGNFLNNINLQSLSEALLSEDKDLRSEALRTLDSFQKVLGEAGPQFGNTAIHASNLAFSIMKMESPTKEVVVMLLQMLSSLQQAGAAAANYESAVKTADETQISFLNSLKRTTEFDALINSLGGVIDTESKRTDIRSGPEEKRLEFAKSLKKTLEDMRRAEIDHERKITDLNNQQLQLLHQATPLQKQTLEIKKQAALKDLEIAKAEREVLNLVDLHKGKLETMSFADKEALNDARLKIGDLMIQRDLLEDQLTLMHQLRTASREAFEGATTTAIKDLITGQQSSFKEAIKGIAMATLDSVAESLAKRMSESISDFLFTGNKPEDKIRQAHIEGGNYVNKMIRDAFPGVTGLPAEGTTSEADGVKKKGFFQTLNEKVFGSPTKSKVSSTQDGSAGPDTVDEQTSKVKTGGIFQNFTNNFRAIFDKNSRPEGMGLIGQMGKTFLNFGTDLGGIFSTILGGLGSGFMSIFGFKMGGYTDVAKDYSAGGVARGPRSGYPAVLHGNEAVVPLPDGRNIPVEMQGGMGTQNNVTVNVNIDSQGNATQNSQSDGAMGENLGRLIASAVQDELQFQKRSGGILNPYGAA